MTVYSSKNSNFCHLHNHTDKGSLLDGLGTAKGYAERAKEMGFKYLGITDHGSIDNTISFQKECLKNDIQPIIGSELYLTSYNDFKGKSGHCCVFVKNETGWRNLCELLSIANLDHFYRRPRIDFNLLYNFCEGLVVTTACAGSWLKLNQAEQFFIELHKKMKGDLYLEIMPHHIDGQDFINKKCLELNKKTGAKLISTADAHYVKREDHDLHDVLLCVQTKNTMDNPNRFRFDFEGSYLQSWEEMLESYNQRGIVDEKTAKKSLFNTLEIAEKCKDFRIQRKEIHLPDIKPYPELSAKENLKKLCQERFEERLGFGIDEKPEYKERFEMEYDVICSKNFESYFLIVEDLISWMRSQNIVTSPGRGSAAGCLLSYILGITEIEPIRHKLVFERFLNPEREEMPDIDIDIPKHNRDQVKRYIIEKYGENNTAGVSTFSNLKGRSVIRDVSRVYGVSLEDVDVFAKTLEDKGGNVVKKAVTDTEEGKAFESKYPLVVQHAISLEGLYRTAGRHAAAAIVSKDNLRKSGQCVLVKRGGEVVINWDMDDAEYSGLMKLDLLGLSQLSIIDECFNLIEETENKKMNIKDFESLDDQEVFSVLSEGNTAGVFQMNTPTMTEYIKEVKINNFEDMSACLALVRPGTKDAGIADEYILRKKGKEYEKKNEIYEDITKDTFSLCIYQENIIFIFTRIAGLSFAVADQIRKIIGKKRDVSEFDKYKDMFVEGCVKNGYFSKSEALQFWTELEASANYLFNKAHSVSYAYLSYVTCWLKIHYPVHFYCANLTRGEADKKTDVVQEAFDIGLKIKLPKIGRSKADKWVADSGFLLAPFSEIKGLGEKQALEISKQEIPKFQPFQGFFKKKDKNEGETKIQFLLNKIKAHDNQARASLEMQELFDFPVSDDLDIVCKTLLDLSKDKYKEKHIKRMYNGKAYGALNLIKDVKRNEDYFFDCRGCSLNGNPFKTVFGDKNIMIVTEHPSYVDFFKNNRLFSCDISNEILMDLYDLGINYEDLTIASAVKCYPGQGKKPVDEHKKACYKVLEEEIKYAEPKLMVMFGRGCVEFFDPEGRPSNYYGKFLWSEKYKCFIFFCYSLGFSFMGADKKYQFKKMLRKFYEMVRRNV